MSGIDRRSFLASGAAALLGAALPDSARQSPRRVQGVIWLWMGGGMSQLETFDPKPGHRNGGDFKAIDTTVPGIQFSELLPLCAAQMKHLSVLRTVCTNEGSHARGTYLLHTGRPLDRAYEFPSIGTILAWELGRRDLPLPAHIVIDPPRIPSGSPFGPEVLPYRIKSADVPIPNLRRRFDALREQDRLTLLRQQNRDWAAGRRQEEMERLGEAGRAADALMDSPLLEAFDYEQEPAGLRRDYGDRFGVNLLLARRLVQFGCPFVEIGMGGWDMRSDLFGNCRRMLPTVDAGIGTLIRDLAEKNLLRDVLVVCATEFGRSPSLNAGKARDVHPNGFSILLAGGGLHGGRVHGDTGPDGETPVPGISAADLFATIFRACGVDATRTYEVSGRTFRYVEGGTPLSDLF